MNFELIRYAVKSLANRRLRSFLTVLSVVIGIMAIFALISFGTGLSTYVDEIAKLMGTDKIIIQSKVTGGMVAEIGFSNEEVDFIKKINGIEVASGMMMDSVKVQPDLNTNPKYVFLIGFATELDEMRMAEDIMTVDIGEGRNLKKGDKMKAVLGYLYSQPQKIFDKPLIVGQKILINDQKVEIVGFYESLGNPQDDSNIAMTQEGLMLITGETVEEYEYIMIQSQPNVDPTELSDSIKNKFRRYKGLDKGKEDFTVQTFEQMIEQFTNILGVLNGILVIIALISVVISGINIMNTMYTSVLERTKDIGIMKAIGGKNSDILIIFVVESGLLGLIGGIVGIFLGYLVSSAGGAFAASAGYSSLQPIFPIELIIGCLLFAFIIGAGSGLAPAIQASRQKPVESLRYE